MVIKLSSPPSFSNLIVNTGRNDYIIFVVYNCIGPRIPFANGGPVTNANLSDSLHKTIRSIVRVYDQNTISTFALLSRPELPLPHHQMRTLSHIFLIPHQQPQARQQPNCVRPRPAPDVASRCSSSLIIFHSNSTSTGDSSIRFNKRSARFCNKYQFLRWEQQQHQFYRSFR